MTRKIFPIKTNMVLLLKRHNMPFWTNNVLSIHDEKHSQEEQRWFCIGKVDNQVLTVRFTYRDGVIRIFGAGAWRKWRSYYEKENR